MRNDKQLACLRIDDYACEKNYNEEKLQVIEIKCRCKLQGLGLELNRCYQNGVGQIESSPCNRSSQPHPPSPTHIAFAKGTLKQPCNLSYTLSELCPMNDVKLTVVLKIAFLSPHPCLR